MAVIRLAKQIIQFPHPPPNTSTTAFNNTNTTHENLNDYNQRVRQYNQQINEKLVDFQNRQMDLCEAADIEQACLFSLNESNIDLPEVVAKMELIFQIRDLPKPDKRELIPGGAQNLSQRANNQALETRNTQLIQEWENDFTQKRAAIDKLKQILNRLQNPSVPETTSPLQPDSSAPKSPEPNPSQPNSAPNAPSPQPADPISKNSKDSEENIKEIENKSLVEAQQKAKQEINKLLDRYGVKALELDANLWDNKVNWENYLTTLNTPQEISSLVKKIKVAIVQQNNLNNQNDQKLTVNQLQDKVIKDIEQLIAKYPSVKIENLLKGGEDWKQKIKSLTTQRQVLNLSRQLREIIINESQSGQRKQKQPSRSSPPPLVWSKLLIPIGLGMVGVSLLVIMIIRKRKFHKSRKRTKF